MDVTGENYAEKAKAFIELQGGGYMIARVYTQHKSGYRMYATPHDWGAWRSYLLGLGLHASVSSMDHRGYYMVPAKSPHLFDAAVSESECIDAGNQFVIHVNRQKDRAEQLVDRDRVLKEMQARRMAA